jgi:hypothetical protein
VSGSTIGGVIGGIIGFWFGAPQLGFMIGSAIGGELDPEVIKGQRLTDAQAQSSNEGVMRPIIYGIHACAGNVIQFGPLVEHKKKKRTGKGGPVQEIYTYTRTYAIRICEGKAGQVLRRVWRDNKLVYDVTGTGGGLSADSAAFASRLTFYDGGETQLPDPLLEALPSANGGGVGNVNAYRGSCYAVIANDDLTDRQGAIPSYRWEIGSCGCALVPAALSWTDASDGTSYGIEAIAGGAGAWMLGGNGAPSTGTLRRSDDNGATWFGVDYTTDTGLNPSVQISNVIRFSGYWYVTVDNNVAYSANGINGWAALSARPYYMPARSAAEIDGELWVGAYAQPTTTIFKMLSPASTIAYAANYGDPSAIAKLNGYYYIGTTSGYILRGATLAGATVVYHPSSDEVRQFAYGLGIVFVKTNATLYKSTDDGLTWSATGLSAYAIVFLGGKFYLIDANYIKSSTDGTTWTTEDSSFAGHPSEAYLTTTTYGILGVTYEGRTAAAGFVGITANMLALPDQPDHGVDYQGTVSGPPATTYATCTETLSVIVADICARVQVAAAQIDVSALTDSVRGYIIGQQLPASDCIRSLQQGYFFDYPEWDLKLRGIKRGGSVQFAITDSNLVLADDDEDVRRQAIEFPRKLNLIAVDPSANYEPVKETASRRTEDVRAVGEATIQLPISMSRDECAQRADILLKIAWMEAEGTWERHLPEEFTQMTPSDRFTHGGKQYRVQKCVTENDEPFFTAVRDRVSAYASAVAGGTSLTPVSPVSSMKGPTVFAAMNLPSLFTTDNTPGMYVAVMGLLAGWVGCDLQLSTDGGVSFVSVATILTPAEMGRLTAAITASSSPIPVEMFADGELASITTDQMAARANGFAIVSGNVSEIGQFQNETLTGVATYDLTGLVRGALNTTAASHSAGDKFVMLDGAVFLPLDIGLAGQTLIFRPVSLGTAAENNAQHSVVFNPVFTSVTIEPYTDDVGNAYVTNADAPYYEST